MVILPTYSSNGPTCELRASTVHTHTNSLVVPPWYKIYPLPFQRPPSFPYYPPVSPHSDFNGVRFYSWGISSTRGCQNENHGFHSTVWWSHFSIESTGLYSIIAGYTASETAFRFQLMITGLRTNIYPYKRVFQPQRDLIRSSDRTLFGRMRAVYIANPVHWSNFNYFELVTMRELENTPAQFITHTNKCLKSCNKLSHWWAALTHAIRNNYTFAPYIHSYSFQSNVHVDPTQHAGRQ